MKKYLLKSVLSLCLIAGAAVSAVAGTTVYGSISGSLNWSMASFDLDLVNEDEDVVPTTLFSMDEVDAVACGASVGDKYYAFYTDGESYNDCFGSFNFTTGEVVKIKEFLTSPMLSALVYNETDRTLYGLAPSDDGETSKVALVKINTGTGAISTVASYDGNPYYDALTTDGNGGFYWIHNVSSYPSSTTSLYHIAADYSLETIYEGKSYPSGYPTYSNSALLMEDGTILYLANTTVLPIDPLTKNISQKGQLSKFVSGMTLSQSTVSGQPSSGGEEEKPNTRLLVRKTLYGDSMGNVPDTKDMKRTEYYYGTDGRLQRVVELGRGYEDNDDYSVMYIYKYNYSEDGLNCNITQLQKGMYDYGDMSWKQKDGESYEYDADGRLISETKNLYKYTYEYDENGNIVKTTMAVKTSGKVSQILVYSQFAGKNMPQMIESTSPSYPNNTSYNYIGICQYDENGNKVAEYRSKDGTSETLIQMETWEYEGTFLKQYNKYDELDQVDDDGERIPSFKTVYTLPDENDPNKIMQTSYTYNTNKNAFYRSGQPALEEYADFKDMAELTATEMSMEEVTDAEIPNTVKLKLTFPQVAATNPCAISIYRDGDLIATKNAMDMIDEGDGDDLFALPTLAYTDEGLMNGEHEYFAQVLIGTGDEFGEPEDMVYSGYNISNMVTYTAALELPAVTDLKAVSTTKDSYNDDIVTIAWTNPEYPESYGFISNSLYLNTSQLAESETDDPEVSSLDASFWFDTMDVLVITRFKYGKALSEKITVNVADVPTGIDTVSGNGARLDGKTLTIGDKADVTVFSCGGRMEASAKAVSSVDMSRLNAGTYIICVTKNGTTKAYKVMLK